MPQGPPKSLQQYIRDLRLKVCKMTGVKQNELDEYLRGDLTSGNKFQAFVEKLRTHPAFWRFDVLEVQSRCPVPANPAPSRLEPPI